MQCSAHASLLLSYGDGPGIRGIFWGWHHFWRQDYCNRLRSQKIVDRGTVSIFFVTEEMLYSISAVSDQGS